MPDGLCVTCSTLPGLTVVSVSGYTGCIGSRERIIPMNAHESIAAVERVATGLHETLVAEFQSPMGSAKMDCEWLGEDFNKVALATPAGELVIVVTSVVGEPGADVRVVVFDPEDCEPGDLASGARVRELGRVARAVAAIPEVNYVWPDGRWPKTFLASVRREGDDL